MSSLVKSASDDLPEQVAASLIMMVRRFLDTMARIGEIREQTREAVEAKNQARLLQTTHGTGPIKASALLAHVTGNIAFRTARDLAAWLGLSPKPHSSGGQHCLSSNSKMDNRYM